MSMALLDDMEAHWPLHIDLHVDLSPVAGHSFCGNVSVSEPISAIPRNVHLLHASLVAQAESKGRTTCWGNDGEGSSLVT